MDWIFGIFNKKLKFYTLKRELYFTLERSTPKIHSKGISALSGTMGSLKCITTSFLLWLCKSVNTGTCPVKVVDHKIDYDQVWNARTADLGNVMNRARFLAILNLSELYPGPYHAEVRDARYTRHPENSHNNHISTVTCDIVHIHEDGRESSVMTISVELGKCLEDAKYSVCWHPSKSK